MPAKSKAQQRLFGAALALKRSRRNTNGSSTLRRLAKNHSEAELTHWAATKHENLPEKKGSPSASPRSARGTTPIDILGILPISPLLKVGRNMAAHSTSKSNLASMTQDQALAKMAEFIDYLADKVPAGTKAAEVKANQAQMSTLTKLAEAVRTHRNLFKAVDEVYGTKSAAYRHKVVSGLVRGLQKKLEKDAAALGVTSHPSGSLDGNAKLLGSGVKEVSDQSQTHTMIGPA